MAGMTARSRIGQLIITYRRDIDREALVEVTRDQWQAQGILRSPRSEAWLRMLQGIWPDVAPGSQLAFVVRGARQFWYRASAAQTAFTPLGPRQSAAFSTRSPSASIRAPLIPNCVSS
jgi:hypothetical protein